MEYKNSRGSLTVEAALVLPLVFISWLMIINLLNMYYMQNCTQQALNLTAKRVAEYCYLMERTGTLDEIQNAMTMDAETSKKTSQIKTGMDGMSESAKKIGREFTHFSLHSIENIVNNVKAFSSSASTAFKALKDVKVDDIKDYIVSEAASAGSGMAIGAMVDGYMEELKVNMTNVTDRSYLASQFLYGSDQYITIVMTYTYHNPLGFKAFSEIKIAQMATVRPWIGDGRGSLAELATR